MKAPKQDALVYTSTGGLEKFKQIRTPLQLFMLPILLVSIFDHLKFSWYTASCGYKLTICQPPVCLNKWTPQLSVPCPSGLTASLGRLMDTGTPSTNMPSNCKAWQLPRVFSCCATGCELFLFHVVQTVNILSCPF